MDVAKVRSRYSVCIEKRFCVYKIKSPSGLIYIGCTQQPRTRIRCHLKRPANRLLISEINKYGKDSMQVEIVQDELTCIEAHELERSLIKSHKSKEVMNVQYTNRHHWTIST